MTWLLLGLGLVLVIEGLALALAPSRIEQVLAFLASQTPDRLRLIGLKAIERVQIELPLVGQHKFKASHAVTQHMQFRGHDPNHLSEPVDAG